MNKYFSLLLSLVILLASAPFSLAVENWKLFGDYTISFTCLTGCGGDWIHTMNVSVYSIDDGTFSGTGHYSADPTITWKVAGDISGNNLTFKINYDGSAYYVDATGTIATDGTMLGSASNLSQTFSWTMTPNAGFNRRAEIIKPTENQLVSGSLDLEAYLIDNEDDYINWAVRKGTCAANTSTVLGNVDGHSDSLTKTPDATNYKYTYTNTFTISSFEDGMYCFVFNPSENDGEDDIRLTREFYIDYDNDGIGANDNCPLISNPLQENFDKDNLGDACDPDDDNDGTLDEDDLCEETVSEAPWNGIGTNRWYWNGFQWIVEPPKGKQNGILNRVKPSFDTHGCSCTQILDKIKELDGGELTGHYKYGCSKSILEEFTQDVKDGDIDGYNKTDPVDTVEVRANKSTTTNSNISLSSGQEYKLKAYKTALAGDSIEFDAMCSIRPPTSSTWTDKVSTYESYDTKLLDLLIDGHDGQWGTTCASDHVYYHNFVGTGTQLPFLIYDIYYPNNSKSLSVDIFKKIY